MNHVEGGWPKEVDHTEAEQVGGLLHSLQSTCTHVVWCCGWAVCARRTGKLAVRKAGMSPSPSYACGQSLFAAESVVACSLRRQWYWIDPSCPPPAPHR